METFELVIGERICGINDIVVIFGEIRTEKMSRIRSDPFISGIAGIVGWGI